MESKKLLIFMFAFVLSLAFVSAHCAEDTEVCDVDFSEAEEIIANNVSCSDLSDSELDVLGDYYMEQVHPDEAHEYMDEMMGGEGSLSLEQVHIAMAYRFYCGEDYYYGGMMGSSGMMGGYYPYSGYGMMGYNYGVNWFLVFLYLVIAVLVFVVVMLVLKLRKRGGKRR